VSEIGSLIVKLRCETAEFQSDMGKIQSDLDALKDKAGATGRGFSSGLGEARGGLMMVEESVGVKLPRHLNTLIAKIPGVGAAFAYMLPIAGVVVAIEIISKLIEKHNEAEEAMRKMGIASANAAVAGTLKMTDLNDKLVEAGIKADDLSGNHIAALRGQLELHH
jgi:hypothetical protein